MAARVSKGHVYDVAVIGSGAAGGWAVKEACERGLDTILLEAGRALDPVQDFPAPGAVKSKVAIVSRVKAILGGQHVQARCMSYSPLTGHLFVSDRKNPYTTPRGQRFNWFRSRQVGGRLHLWGRNALRISDEQLHPADRDGFGENWPIGYEDLEAWYTRVENFLGVQGSAAGIPSIPDGHYIRPHPITKVEERVLADLAREWPDRPATTCRIVTHNPGRIPLPIVAAQETGNLTLRSDAVVSEVLVDPDSGLATGVAFADRETGERHEIPARAVMVCASTIESLRILLNSRSAPHPDGLGNSSGRLGQYLTDHPMVFQAGPIQEELEGGFMADAYDFGSQSGIYIPSFVNVGDRHEPEYLRGFSMLGSVGRIEPGWFFMAIGEMLPRAENRVELDESKRDAWGIPAAKITCTHSANERAMVRAMKGTLERLARDCGLGVDHLQGESILNKTVYKLASPLVYTEDGALVPGSAIHETGGAGMGSDPATSVLNGRNQVWDAPNVLVTDSSSFTTSPFQNPGLTIMALSARAANYVADSVASEAW